MPSSTKLEIPSPMHFPELSMSFGDREKNLGCEEFVAVEDEFAADCEEWEFES